MASFLKDLSLAIGLLTSDQAPIPDQYGWKDFVWRIRPIEHCMMPDAGMCKVITENWDWKRDQQYSFAVQGFPATNGLTIRLGLNNRDPEDRDDVCIVAIFTNANDKEVAIFYQNWASYPGRNYARDTPLQLAPKFPVGTITKVIIGVKQCDPKNAVDAQLFYSIRTMLDQR